MIYFTFEIKKNSTEIQFLFDKFSSVFENAVNVNVRFDSIDKTVQQ